MDIATLVARGYTRSGKAPRGKLSRLYLWPWATLLGSVTAIGAVGAALLYLYKLIHFLALLAWPM
jgi:hypothetical protein